MACAATKTARFFTVVISIKALEEAREHFREGNMFQAFLVGGLGSIGIVSALHMRGQCFIAGTQVFDGEVLGGAVGATQVSAGDDGFFGSALAAGAAGMVAVGLAGYLVHAPAVQRRRRGKRAARPVELALAAAAGNRGLNEGDYTSNEDAFAEIGIRGFNAAELQSLVSDCDHGDRTHAASAAELSTPLESQPEDAPVITLPPLETRASFECPRARRRTSGSAGRFATAWLACCLLFAAGLGALAWVWRGGDTAENSTVPTEVAHSGQTVTNLSSRNIEDLRPGDLVLSRDPFTGELGRRPVAQTFTRVSDHLRVLTIVDDNGGRHTLHTTDEHPFFLADGDQVAAGELLPGDEFATADGQFAALLDTRYEPHPEGVTVYNFEVADHHTYHVAAHGARGPPVLVHNSSGDCAAGVKPGRLPKKTVSAAESAWRQQHRAERMIRSGRGLPPGGSASKSEPGVSNEAHNAASFARYKAELARSEAAQATSGAVVVRRPFAGATAAQEAQIREYVSMANLAEAEGYMSATGRVSTQGQLRAAASRAAAQERARAAAAGTPYRGVVGHGPDTTWTGRSDAPYWIDMDHSINSSIGRQALDYPLGYRPRRFIFEGDW